MNTRSFAKAVICPRCRYQRQAADVRLDKRVCPSCGIVYNKFLEQLSRVKITPAPPAPLSPLRQKPPLRDVLWETFFFVPSDRHESAFWGQLLLFVLFFFYGLRFIMHGVDPDFIGNTFVHLPNLAIHEFGHMIFRPFGQFMSYLGGSLAQIMLPLGLMLYFSLGRRENFGASLLLWWTGQNFIDVSP